MKKIIFIIFKRLMYCINYGETSFVFFRYHIIKQCQNYNFKELKKQLYLPIFYQNLIMFY